jgi:hypothetical protein
MSQFIRLFLFFGAVVTSLAACAAQYQRQTHPEEHFVIEYLTSWKPYSGKHNASFSIPDHSKADVSIRVYPRAQEDSATAEAYIARFIEVVKQEGGQLNGKDIIQVSGRAATKLEFAVANGWGPVTGVSIIIPDGPQYYVASLHGKEADVTAVRPQFDRLVVSLRLGPMPKSLKEIH